MQLESDKFVDVVDVTKFTWRKSEFHISTSCVILNMKNDLILDENFWKKYRLTSDYETISIRVWQNEKQHVLSSIVDHRSRLRILSNQSSEAEVVSRRVFERLVRKSAKSYLYVVRKIDSSTEENAFRKAVSELASLQRTIDNLRLNRILRIDLLKIFRNDLSNKSSSKRSQNYRIDIDDARSMNKFFYELFKKQNDE